MKYNRERAWIKKKLKSGISQGELYHTVGMFSNKSKKRVMIEKRLSEKGYDKRYKFLCNVHFLLGNEKF